MEKLVKHYRLWRWNRWRKASKFLNKYDTVSEVASLGDSCTFCELIQCDIATSLDHRKELNDRVVYRDDFCVIFPDRRQDRCTAHY